MKSRLPMPTCRKTLLVLVLLGLGLALGLGARPLHAQRGAALAPAHERFASLPEAAEWHALLDRDRRLSFTERTAGIARTVLEVPLATLEQRAVAWLALGAAGAVAERVRLERIARSGPELEARAAILALGLMGAASDDFLEAWIRGPDAARGQCALLALLEGDRGAGRRRVEELAADTRHPLAAVAGDLLVFVLDPSASRPTSAAVTLLRLRFEAARRFGLVDGQDWEGLVVRRLAADEGFVRDMILSSVRRLRTPPVRDHVLAALLEHDDLPRLRAAVDVLPVELSDLVENELWRPRVIQEWHTLLDEIESRRLERLTLPILRAAIDVEHVRYRAIALTSLAGDEDLSPLLGLDTSKISVEERIQVCAAIGARSDPGWLERFASLSEDRNPRVRAAFLVVGFQLGNKRATKDLDEILGDAQHAEHKAVVNALCAAARDPEVSVRLEARLLETEGEEKTTIATALCLEGHLVGRAAVRAALATEPRPTGFLAVRLVRALQKNASAEDLEVFQELFPTESEPALDRELALALLERGDPAVLPLVRAAIWGRDVDLSLLAAGIFVDVGGVRALIEELRAPPASASSGDLRRVGLAVGEWGGVDAVETLARELRFSSGHPAVQGALLGWLSTRTQ